MWAIVPYLVPLGIIVAANLGVTRRGWRRLAYAALGLLNLVACLAGLLLMVTPSLPGASRQVGLTEVVNTAPFGAVILLTALLGFLVLIPAVRRFLSRRLAIDPDSPVHATALVMVLYLAASSLSLLVLPPASLLDSIQSVSLGSGALVSGEAVMALFGLAGVGLGTRRNVRQVLARLGLRRPALSQLVLSAGIIVFFLALDYAVSIVWSRLWPLNYQMVSESSQRLFAPFDSIPGALLLGLSAGIGEETLFRGALQPRLRIPLTALLFTLGHVQYTLSPALLEIFLIGLVLGWLRERTNTATCMVTHAGYNFLDTILMRFFP